MAFKADIGRSSAENTMLILFKVNLDIKRKIDAIKEIVASVILNTG